MRPWLLQVAALVLSVASLLSTVVPAQQPATDPTIQSLRRDMDELIKGQIELQKQVQELKNLLQPNPACGQAAQPPKQNIVLDTAGSPDEGQIAAPVTMIEFSDFQCPFSARYTNEIFPQIEQAYIRTGKIRYVFRDFPLENMHPLAHKLAESGQCASEQKRFWEMRAKLFAAQATITSEQAIVDQGKSVSLDSGALQKCLRDRQYSGKVDQERSEASSNGVTGTPTFFLGRTDPGSNKIKVTKVIVGAQPFENFKQAIDSILAEQRPAGNKI